MLRSLMFKKVEMDRKKQQQKAQEKIDREAGRVVPKEPSFKRRREAVVDHHRQASNRSNLSRTHDRWLSHNVRGSDLSSTYHGGAGRGSRAADDSARIRPRKLGITNGIPPPPPRRPSTNDIAPTGVPPPPPPPKRRKEALDRTLTTLVPTTLRVRRRPAPTRVRPIPAVKQSASPESVSKAPSSNGNEILERVPNVVTPVAKSLIDKDYELFMKEIEGLGDGS